MQQSNVGRLSTGRDSDKPGIPPPPMEGDIFDPCRPTSTCSRRWPYKIPVHTLYSTVRCVSSLAGINRCYNPSQSISK